MEQQPEPKRGVRNPAVLAWLRLARVFQKVDTLSARFFRSQDIKSPAQFDVLAQIGTSQGITQQELAAKLMVTKGNISQLLSQMERNGLVARCQEGRANLLSLTDAGNGLFEQVVPAQEQLIAQLFAPLTPEEQHQLLTLLRKLDRNLET